MTCSAEFPCYSTIASAVERAVRESTIPAPPPEDDGGTLHVMTLDVARETIALLKEREAEHLAKIAQLESAVVMVKHSEQQWFEIASGHVDRIHQLEARIAELTSEKR